MNNYIAKDRTLKDTVGILLTLGILYDAGGFNLVIAVASTLAFLCTICWVIQD